MARRPSRRLGSSARSSRRRSELPNNRDWRCHRRARARCVKSRPLAERGLAEDFRQSPGHFLEGFGILSLTFPHDDAPPAEILERRLMNFVARGVAFELRQPPFAAVGRRRAVFAAAMPVPEAAVNEYRGFVFRQKN